MIAEIKNKVKAFLRLFYLNYIIYRKFSGFVVFIIDFLRL